MIAHELVDTRMTECGGGSLCYAFAYPMDSSYLEGWKSYGHEVPRAGESVIVYRKRKHKYFLAILYIEDDKIFWLDLQDRKHEVFADDIWILNPQG